MLNTSFPAGVTTPATSVWPVQTAISKAAATTAHDPDTGQEISLFNPRLQVWSEHFEWTEDSTLIRGLTSTGRATVTRLQMNRPRIVLAHRRWAQARLHPVQTQE